MTDRYTSALFAVAATAGPGLAATNPARAEWHGATWGISMSQTEQAVQLPLQAIPPGERRNDAPGIVQVTGEPLLAFTVTEGAYHFDHGKMFFRNGALFTIAMELVDGRDCDRLLNTLTGAYRAPVHTETLKAPDGSFVNQSFEWQDRKKDNLVDLQIIRHGNPHYESECFVRLFPLETPPGIS